MELKTQSCKATIGDVINRIGLADRRELLYEQLLDYISQALYTSQKAMPKQKHIDGSECIPRIPYHFECLIMCQSACAGRSDEKCISRSLINDGAARALQGAVTFGQMLNVERKL